MMLKFLQGGGAVSPLLSFNPVIVTGKAAETPTTTQQSNSGSDLTDEEVLKMLDKMEGLPSDMKEITDELQNFYINQHYDPNPDTSNIQTRYIKTISKIKNSAFHKSEYDRTLKTVEKNGGLNEIAIDERGRLLCMNKEGDFKRLKVEELETNSGYQPLTNSELLWYRANDPDLAFNSNLLPIVENGIGMQTVNTMINTIIDRLGTSSSTNEGYISSDSKQLLNGIKAYVQASQSSIDDFNPTLDNLYKYSVIDKSQKRQIELAFNYIYATLPENAKTLLKVKSDGTDNGAKTLISQMINSQASYTSDYKITMDTPNSSSGSSKSGKSGGIGGIAMNPVSLLQAQYGQKQQINIQTAEGGNNGIQVNTVRMPIVKKDGNSIGSSSTLNDVTTSGFAGMLDFENASMGGSMIPTVGFENIAINGTALYTAYLPIDIHEYNTTGNIKPDIAMLGRYKEAQDIILKEKITDPKKINEIYREHNLPIMFDGKGDVLTNYKSFGIINGTALESAFNTDVDFDDYLRETTDENEIANALHIINKNRGGGNEIDHDSKSFFDSLLGTDYDRVYKGTIFIPVNEDYFTATAGFGEYPTNSEAQAIEALQQGMDRQEIANKKYVNPGRL